MTERVGELTSDQVKKAAERFFGKSAISEDSVGNLAQQVIQSRATPLQNGERTVLVNGRRITVTDLGAKGVLPAAAHISGKSIIDIEPGKK